MPGEGLEEDSAQMIRTMPAIYQLAWKQFFFDFLVIFLFLFGVNLVVPATASSSAALLGV